MADKFYKKKYAMQSNGCLILANPVPVLEYNRTITTRLLNAQTRQELRNIKIEILSDFQEILAYDFEYADFPEPFGHFESEDEKKHFIKRKMLNETFALYLANIFLDYHYNLIRSGRLPILRTGKMVIDYNELYDHALSEYIGVLCKIPQPVLIQGDNVIMRDVNIAACVENAAGECNADVEKSGCIYMWQDIEYRGVKSRILVPVNKIPIPKPSEHAISTSYVLPSLIEHFLGIELQNRVLRTSLKKFQLHYKDIVMTDEEKNLINFFINNELHHAVLNGTQEYNMRLLADVFVRSGSMEDTDENKMLLIGRGKRSQRTLGGMLKTNYVKEQITPAYFNLLDKMFSVDQMNIRNSIMHGTSDTFDYLAIGVASVMLQMLWDISSEDMFIRTRAELLSDVS